ncbi:hypothetical protein GCM10010954_20120 [Halobacillus andaensis]|uniref:Uncharacterized protein n=1 Tax=Halobacillus andaensis TaxID=1176239 RepID=A0A917B3K4_HALAA|nr:hypothetical protein [Halobacillus andaensis]GGF21285.1 hypothetical protein GCM10010954_20120 [Halobacillus andaensis]
MENKWIAILSHFHYINSNTIEYLVLRGRVKIPAGGNERNELCVPSPRRGSSSYAFPPDLVHNPKPTVRVWMGEGMKNARGTAEILQLYPLLGAALCILKNVK